MKTAIYIEDGTVQLVLTPESAFEQQALRTLDGEALTTRLFAGAFYDCRGGWVRQADDRGSVGYGSGEERSLIIRVDTRVEPQADVRYTGHDREVTRED